MAVLEGWVVASSAVIALCLVLGGGSKVRAPGGGRGTVFAAAFPRLAGRRGWVGAGAVEVAVAVLLVVWPRQAAIQVATAGLFAVMGVALAVAVRRAPVPKPCGCMGAHGRSVADASSVGRTFVLAAVCVANAVVVASARPRPSAPVAVVVLLVALGLVGLALLYPEVIPRRAHRLVGAELSRVRCRLARRSVAPWSSAVLTSPMWIEVESVVASTRPLDVWREGCWEFVSFAGAVAGAPVTVVCSRPLRPALGGPRFAVVEDAGSSVLAFGVAPMAGVA